MYQSLRKYDLIIGLSCVTVIYLLINFILPKFRHDFLNTYLIRPILFGLLAFIIYKMPNYRPYGKPRARSMLILAGLTVAGFQLILMFMAGLFEGFGKSPYSFSPLGILLNIFYVYGSLLGMELSRAWFVNRCSRRHPSLTIAWVALMYTLLVFPYSKLTTVDGLQGGVRFLGETLLPSFAESLLTTFLAFLGGPLPAIAYRGLFQLFMWFSPILPNLNWTSLALINVVVPVIGFVLVQKLYIGEIKQSRHIAHKKDNPVSWIVVSIISTLILWFPTGLLGVYPTVVISGSMRPNIEIGDMIILKKVNPEQVKEGDIIEFIRADRKMVTHRVTDIIKDPNAPYLITKGDANSMADDPVLFQNVKGKVIGKLPKIGWASITVRKLISLKPDTWRGVN